MQVNAQVQSAPAPVPNGRLERPWRVFLLGITLATAFLAVMYVRIKAGAPMEAGAARGVIGFAIWAVLMSGCYAYIGARSGTARANRIVGWSGLTVALGAVFLLLWAMLPQAR